MTPLVFISVFDLFLCIIRLRNLLNTCDKDALSDPLMFRNPISFIAPKAGERTKGVEKKITKENVQKKKITNEGGSKAVTKFTSS